MDCCISFGESFWSNVKGDIGEHFTVPNMTAPDGSKKLNNNEGKQQPRSIANSVFVRVGGLFCPLIGNSCTLISLSVTATIKSS